jgi:glutaryl-CoA dehydrogenase
LPGPLAPRVLDAFRREQTDPAIFRELGALDMSGITIPETYGGAGLNYVSYGLVAREVERVDSGFRSMMSVQGSLVMLPINEFGTEAQKQQVPAEARDGGMDGCFGLTEPNSAPIPAAWSAARRRSRRLRAHRHEVVDHQQSHRRRVHRLGQGR